MSNRRLPAEAGNHTQTPGRTTCADVHAPDLGDMTVREVVAAGGLLRSEGDRVKKEAPPVERLTYTVAELAEAVRVSDQQIYNHIKRGDLTPRYSGRKALIPVEEARRFVAELPDEDLGPLV